MLNRLNKPNICVAHCTTLKTLVQLGSDHDRRLKQWRDDLATGMCLCSDDNCEVCDMYCDEHIKCIMWMTVISLYWNTTLLTW